ncbi:hypothetical protein EUGRSUZ_C02740 [Eucalyptus grandis]|uniref:Uncharacterized protein n=2 Tax=Eucalyptus grandis TaxID=71139 RepID=A0ACC3LGH8_EUCGR|nr:hypothetical protein EUGRSUZ_C02740 [Eucalyptus grandis]
MGSLLVLVGVCFLVVWLHHYSVDSQTTGLSGIVVDGSVFINGSASIASIDDDFICATLDYGPPDVCHQGTCWGNATLFTLDLSNPILLNAIKAFSPLKIRMGGTLQDKLIYHSVNSVKCRAIVTFGLNALYGRTVNSDGSVHGPWDSSNAEILLRYTVNKGYTIHGWELGNELSGQGIGAQISAQQYASDIKTLQNLLDDIYGGFEVKPLILAPGGFFDANWFKDFVDHTTQMFQVVTHHVYSLGAGYDDNLTSRILDPSYLNGMAQTFSSLESILKNSGTSAVAWVGEAGGAYGGGHHLVTDAFVSSFWYLDQLAMAATYNTKTYCRQTLIGGGYGLLNSSTFQPNPDYYSALLWHRLMGNNVLFTNFTGTNKLRAYSHCSKNSVNGAGNGTLILQPQIRSRKSKFSRISKGLIFDANIREEYHLTAKDRDLHSQVTLLNGKILSVDSSGNIPALNPIQVRMSDPILVASFSVAFARFPSMNVTACR